MTSREEPRRRYGAKDMVLAVVTTALLTTSFWSFQVSVSIAPAGLAADADTGFLPDDKSRAVSMRDLPEHVDLVSLTAPAGSVVCPPNLRYVKNRNAAVYHDAGRAPAAGKRARSARRIPKIVHVTSKSRCLTETLADNVERWMFDDHAFFFHDDVAVQRLLDRHWHSFPHLPVARTCLRSGAATADLWRYLVLWEYGGIYTDIDNAPGRRWNSTLISDDDDAFFVVEHIGVLSQYFMAASRRHPLMYLAVQNALHRVLGVDHVGKQNVPQVTGPGALKMAFKYFMRNHDTKQYGRVKAGRYVGLEDRSVTVIGGKQNSSMYVSRSVIRDKGQEYRDMDMLHYNDMPKKKFNESCFVHLWNLQYGSVSIDLANW